MNNNKPNMLKIYEREQLDLKQKRLNLLSTNEKTIQNIIVVDFLKMLGYKDIWYIYENDIYNSQLYSDISICIDGNTSIQLQVEVKKDNKPINPRDLEQLSRYINAKKGSWGIVSNGTDFILYNDKIIGEIDERIVFHYNLATDKNEEYLKYYSYEYIFKRNISNYFKYIKQYEIYFCKKNNPTSFAVYKGTLTNFFEYIAEIKQYNFPSIEFITPNDLKSWIIYDKHNGKSENGRHVNKSTTIKNKFHHINSMYQTLKRNGNILSNPFENIDINDFINDIDFINESDKIHLRYPLTINEILSIIKAQENKRDNLRNELFIYLLSYTGIGKNEIIHLKEEQVDIENKIITLKGRAFKLPDIIIDKIVNYRIQKKEYGLSPIYIFPSKYSHRKNNTLSLGYLNDVINDSLQNFDSIRKDNIDIQFFHESLVKEMYKVGFWIEEIAYFTGSSIPSVVKVLGNIDIGKKIEGCKFFDKHPYKQIFKPNKNDNI